jgi:hypothetical protein
MWKTWILLTVRNKEYKRWGVPGTRVQEHGWTNTIRNKCNGMVTALSCRESLP